MKKVTSTVIWTVGNEMKDFAVTVTHRSSALLGVSLFCLAALGCGSGTTEPQSAYAEPVLPEASDDSVNDAPEWEPMIVAAEDAPTGGLERPESVRSSGFFVRDGRLYDKHGVEFIIRGLSNPHAWFDSRKQAINALDDISDHEFNTVRIVWEASGGFAASWLRQVIQQCLAERLVPMLELHDVTGSRSNADLMKMAEYLAQEDVKEVLVEFEEYLLINVANEWSGNDWVGGYRAVVEHLRDNDIFHTLVLDANGWGQNATVLFEDGPTLLEEDPEHNLMFSTHMYEVYADPSTIEATFQRAEDERLPFMVGEFGFEHNGHEIDVDVILNEATDRGYGYIAWSWIGNSSDVAHLDMAEDWNGPLTDWGRWVVDGAGGVAETSVRASFFVEP